MCTYIRLTFSLSLIFAYLSQRYESDDQKTCIIFFAIWLERKYFEYSFLDLWTKSNFDEMWNISALHQFYSEDKDGLAKTINGIYDRIEVDGLNPIWISIIPRQRALDRVKELFLIEEKDRVKYPLYGIPFAVKDNIDVVALPTTAGCPKFAHQSADQSAPVVQKLEKAGAILIGKCNMDQFATGLVGTRSPYEACSSVFNENFISGGSSSGSAVAVASGLVTIPFY